MNGKDGSTANPRHQAKHGQPISLAVLDDFADLRDEIHFLHNLIAVLRASVSGNAPGEAVANFVAVLAEEADKVNHNAEHLLKKLRSVSNELAVHSDVTEAA